MSYTEMDPVFSRALRTALVQRVTRSPRANRWTVVGVTAATAAAAAVALVVGQVFLGSGRGPYVPSEAGPVATTFEVPTYERDGNGGMDAVVGGTLWFTPEGCTLMSYGGGPERVTTAVFFPNATGVIYDNGVRAVVDRTGKVFAVEGQEFSYGGGHYVEPDSELGRRWLAQCPETELREGAVVHDEPANPELTEAPAPPAEAGPTAPTSKEELGYYQVPTFAWDPVDAGEETIEGKVTFTEEGCPVIESEKAGEAKAVGLILPNAEGRRSSHDGSVVYSTSPNGTGGIAVLDGDEVSYRGREAGADDERWASVCEGSPVDAVFYANAPFPVD